MSPNANAYINFLNLLANNKIITDFTRRLVYSNHREFNEEFFNMGARWVNVEDALGGEAEASAIFQKFGLGDIDPCSLKSPHQLMAQYIPYEDYVNDGAAIVLFTLPLNAVWVHTSWVSGDKELMGEFLK